MHNSAVIKDSPCGKKSEDVEASTFLFVLLTILLPKMEKTSEDGLAKLKTMIHKFYTGAYSHRGYPRT